MWRKKRVREEGHYFVLYPCLDTAASSAQLLTRPAPPHVHLLCQEPRLVRRCASSDPHLRTHTYVLQQLDDLTQLLSVTHLER